MVLYPTFLKTYFGSRFFYLWVLKHGFTYVLNHFRRSCIKLKWRGGCNFHRREKYVVNCYNGIRRTHSYFFCILDAFLWKTILIKTKNIYRCHHSTFNEHILVENVNIDVFNAISWITLMCTQHEIIFYYNFATIEHFYIFCIP